MHDSLGPPTTLRPPPAWRVWDNPLLRRYLRSQLRWRELLAWVVLMLSICAWMTLAIYGYILREEKEAPTFAARCAWVPLLFLQSFILLFQGTSAVASGVVREGMDGMIRYQRLTPLSPLAKTVGYLLGLPLRAWVLFALTLPFAVWLCIQGQVPQRIWAPIYAVMLSTALLYHLTGLLLGLVIPQGRRQPGWRASCRICWSRSTCCCRTSATSACCCSNT